MAILSIYCDESGKFNDKKVISFCGLSATRATFDKFETRWQELLKRHGIAVLKASEAFNPARPLSSAIPRQEAPERVKSLEPFAACVSENFEFGLAMAVNVEAYRQTRQDVKRRIGGGDDPFYFAFLRVVTEFLDQDHDRHVSLVCDDDQSTARNCLGLYRRLKNMGDAKFRRLSSIAFADDSVFVALQAADMLSGLIRLEAGRRFFDEPFPFKPLAEYLCLPRGPQYTQWGFVFAGQREMARLDLAFKVEM